MVAQHACEHIISLRYILCMMSISFDGPTWMFGDNASVITPSTILQSTQTICHNASSYHCVHECVVTQVVYLLHIDGILNPSDSLTEALGWVNICPLILQLLFWKGKTILVIKEHKNNSAFTLGGHAAAAQYLIPRILW
jgi:hypothetical protein